MGIQFCERVGHRGWAQTFSTRSLPSQVPQLPWITFLNLVSGIIIFWVVNIKRRQCWTVAQVFAHYTARRHLSPQYNRVALLDFPGGTVDRCKYYAPLPGGIIINTLYEQMHSAQCRCTCKIVTLWFCAPWHGWLVWVGGHFGHPAPVTHIDPPVSRRQHTLLLLTHFLISSDHVVSVWLTVFSWTHILIGYAKICQSCLVSSL